MKRMICMLVFISALLVGNLETYAQMELPAPSPAALVKQTVGVTDITINYSSPGVKGRQIWGGLEPYNEVWRTGANAATTIEFSKDVTIEGKTVPAGKYSLLTIPGKETWVVIINSDLKVSEENYDKTKDIVRINAKPQEIPLRERMAFIFSNFDDNKTDIDLEWEKVRVRFSVNVATDAQALASIEKQLGNTWRDYANAARYTLRSGLHRDKGLQWVNKSIELNEDWYNHWIKAELLKEQGNWKEAYKHLQKSKELGDKSAMFFMKDEVEKNLVEWKKKI